MGWGGGFCGARSRDRGRNYHHSGFGGFEKPTRRDGLQWQPCPAAFAPVEESGLNLSAFLFRIGLLFGLLCVVVSVFWCALAKSPAMVEICWMPVWLGKQADAYPIFRNFPAFALLSFFVSLSLGVLGGIRRVLNPLAVTIVSAFFASAVGVGLEFAQLWIPARSFDLLDIAWTLAGAMTGALLAIPLLLLALQKTRND